jgi:predicted Zn-dependent peptidase
MDHEIFRLKNGIRILFKPCVSPISHCCLIINSGSRDEKAGEPGLAHFIEHLLFKGTEKRNNNQILNRLEVVGADLNAYTTKEYTCLHASFLHKYLERAIDLLQDIAFHSKFSEKEMEKEKGVILDEILSYEDQPEEAINDDFEKLLFKDHPLGENILGTAASVEKFKSTDLKEFINKNYVTSDIVFAINGNYKSKDILKLAEKYFSIIPENTGSKIRTSPPIIAKQEITISKPINQAHCIIGSRAYSFLDNKKHGLTLLNNLLGGNGMSSRLNLELREKYGIAYTIESNYTPFSDTGIFSIYFGTDIEKTNKAFKLIYKEINKLKAQKLGTLQLHQTKQKFNGQIALGEENRMGVLISMAKSLLDFNKIESLEEVFNKINKVKSEEILAIANEIMNTDNLNTLLFIPDEEED